VGACEGLPVGRCVGAIDGEALGVSVGIAVVGAAVGLPVVGVVVAVVVAVVVKDVVGVVRSQLIKVPSPNAFTAACCATHRDHNTLVNMLSTCKMLHDQNNPRGGVARSHINRVRSLRAGPSDQVASEKARHLEHLSSVEGAEESADSPRRIRASCFASSCGSVLQHSFRITGKLCAANLTHRKRASSQQRVDFDSVIVAHNPPEKLHPGFGDALHK